MSHLDGKRVLVSGGSRGIGLEIAKKIASQGGRVALLAKTAEPHPNLPGTLYTAAEEVASLGGEALPIVTDIRFEDQVKAAVASVVSEFGGIDICINNASAISLTPTEMTSMKRFDLMFAVNVRGTFLLSKESLPHLVAGVNPHILTLSPPLDMKPHWFAPNLAYTLSKFGMSQCVLGLAAEYANRGVAVNALWPHSVIATAAITNIIADQAALGHCRKPDIVADAAVEIISREATTFSGHFCIDDVLLSASGVDDFSHYRVDPTKPLWRDFFIPSSIEEVETMVSPSISKTTSP